MGCQRLPTTDGHRDDPELAAGPTQVLDDAKCQDGTSRPDRMTQGDRTAIRAGPLRVETDVPAHGDRLRCQGFVQLHDVDVDSQTRTI